MGGVNRWEVDPDDEIVFFCADGSWYELTEIGHPGTPYNVAVEAKAQLRRIIKRDEATR